MCCQMNVKELIFKNWSMNIEMCVCVKIEIKINKNTQNVYIRGLPQHFTKEKLIRLCRDFGEVDTDWVEHSASITFVRFKTAKGAAQAIHYLNGRPCLQGFLLAKLANSDPGQPKVSVRLVSSLDPQRYENHSNNDNDNNNNNNNMSTISRNENDRLEGKDKRSHHRNDVDRKHGIEQSKKGQAGSQWPNHVDNGTNNNNYCTGNSVGRVIESNPIPINSRHNQPLYANATPCSFNNAARSQGKMCYTYTYIFFGGKKILDWSEEKKKKFRTCAHACITYTLQKKKKILLITTEFNSQQSQQVLNDFEYSNGTGPVTSSSTNQSSSAALIRPQLNDVSRVIDAGSVCSYSSAIAKRPYYALPGTMKSSFFFFLVFGLKKKKELIVVCLFV
ncbi:hypothetical protein RFI_02228 [Reticulomyxa filosa]|uniref:RRM domain-containing protein n=1 Tax=Reticulomyxa filosa TaxID=46433 RepID=X6P9Q8_RETFI|nr:hypothetical protein RFI_02228 [Reticulomyxa filosa]|eukprot:ETO34858.1 hypothetical protein RFI_02228 [Reticulomyxa filosa]